MMLHAHAHTHARVRTRSHARQARPQHKGVAAYHLFRGLVQLDGLQALVLHRGNTRLWSCGMPLLLPIAAATTFNTTATIEHFFCL